MITASIKLGFPSVSDLQKLNLSELIILTKHADPCLRRAIALLDDSPKEILEELILDEDQLIRNSILERKLAEQWKPQNTWNLNYEKLSITSDLAALRILSSSGDAGSRRAVAENKTPLLISWKNCLLIMINGLREEVAANKTTPMKTKERLKHDLFETVRQAAYN